MHIALITPEFINERYDGGLANYTYRLALNLIELGHKAEVIVCGDEDRFLENDRIPVHYFDANKPLRPSLSQGAPEPLGQSPEHRWLEIALEERSRHLNDQVRVLHRRQPFDLIQYAHLGGLAFHCPQDIPTIVRLSSSTRLCHSCNRSGKTDDEMEQQERVENTAMQRVSAVFGPSQMVADYVRAQINRPIKVIETPFQLNPGAWDERFYQEHLAGTSYLLFYGSLATLKGVETIARCLNELLSAHPDLHFVFAGRIFHASNGQPMDELLRAAASAYQSRLHLFDRLKHPQLYPIVKNAAGVILPSLVDNLANTCIEAMGLKRVVVGSDKNGFEQLIDHGISGYQVPIDDDRELLRTINRLLALPLRDRERMGEAAAKRVEQLAPDKVVAQLLDYYQETICSVGNS